MSRLTKSIHYQQSCEFPRMGSIGCPFNRTYSRSLRPTGSGDVVKVSEFV
jgi:hypothetical protein